MSASAEGLRLRAAALPDAANDESLADDAWMRVFALIESQILSFNLYTLECARI